MKISPSNIVYILLFVGFSKIGLAQIPIVAQSYLENVVSDSEKYMDNYMKPILEGLGYGFNNGWYNTARPHKSLGFDLTISANLTYVPLKQQIFGFIAKDYKVYDTSDSKDAIIPTVMGGSTTTEIKSVLDKSNPKSPYVVFPVLDGFQDQLPVSRAAIPSPIIQLGVGIFKGTEIKVGWMPIIQTTDELGYNYFRLAVMHSVSQWLPTVKDMDFLDISGLIGFTNVKLNYMLDPSTIAGINQTADLGVNTLTFQVIASANASVITGFIGVGYDSFKSHLSMNGEYEIEIPGTSIKETLTESADFNAKGGGLRATAGTRLKLAIFTLHAAYTLQRYNTLNAGFGFSFR